MSEEVAEDNPNQRKWRKKRKNFLSNAKKYAKLGQMGRGTKMSDEFYQYFVGIIDTMKKGIEDPEERHVLVNNVLERTKGEELNVVGNQLGSRVVELLLPFSSPEDLERFMDVLFPELRKLCSDNFTSHVVETLLRVASERATEHLQSDQNGDVDDSEEPKKKKKKEEVEKQKYKKKHIKKCHKFTINLCRYALNNLEDFVWDQYANHILRRAIKCLSGITLLPGEKRKVNLFIDDPIEIRGVPPSLTKLEYRIVPEEFSEIAKEFANRLSLWPQFKDLPFKNITSGLLQVLLYAVKHVDKNMTRDLLKKLLNECFAPDDWVATSADEKKDVKIDVDDEEEGVVKEESSLPSNDLPPVFKSESAVRLLEVALLVAKRKSYTQLYARCFINRLARLAATPMLNYTVQRLLDYCQDKNEFEPMYDELSAQLGALLACGNTGVLVALAKACLRLQARQAHFVTALESALQCSAPEQQKLFSVCCLRLLPADSAAPPAPAPGKDFFIHIHGSVILQTILHFQRPAKAVSGLLELEAEQLLVVFCDRKGSYVADALCSAGTVGVKARDKLVWRLKGCYQKLALNQHGSRSLEAVFNCASLEQKAKIMSELADKSSLLNSTQYGRLIADKLELATFKTSQKKWEKIWARKQSNIDK